MPLQKISPVCTISCSSMRGLVHCEWRGCCAFSWHLEPFPACWHRDLAGTATSQRARVCELKTKLMAVNHEAKKEANEHEGQKP